MPMSQYEKRFAVLLYDMERYAGEKMAPNYIKGRDLRFGLAAYRKSLHTEPYSLRLLWTAWFQTYDEARRMVEPGGLYFDRTGNHPSPMVPIEGWAYDIEPRFPKKQEIVQASIG